MGSPDPGYGLIQDPGFIRLPPCFMGLLFRGYPILGTPGTGYGDKDQTWDTAAALLVVASELATTHNTTAISQIRLSVIPFKLASDASVLTPQKCCILMACMLCVRVSCVLPVLSEPGSCLVSGHRSGGAAE